MSTAQIYTHVDRSFLDQTHKILPPPGVDQPMKKQVKKRHHYRPVHQLRHFADSKGLLWVYDRTGVRARQDIPERIGYEQFLYAPDSGPEPKDDAVENWLEREIDTPSARPLESLIRGTLPSSDAERSRLSAYLSMQDMRTPRAREYLLDSFQAHLDYAYAEWTRDLPRLQQAILDSEGVRYSLEELSQMVAEHNPIAAKGIWLEFIMDSVNNGGERIFHMRWQVVDAPPGLEFLTSDIGIIKYVDGFLQPCTWRLGFSLGVTHWLVPLSSSRALALIPANDPRPCEPTSRLVKAANKRLVLDATRYIFSRRHHAFVEKWWKEQGTIVPDFIIPPDF